VTDEITLRQSKNWTASEALLYVGSLVRVLGDRDQIDRVLVEFLSGPLCGERRWFTESELQRKAEQPE
jgi:hypothetical protein